jgi:hypothetical protein
MEKDEPSAQPSARRLLCSRFGVMVGVMLAVTFGVMRLA